MARRGRFRMGKKTPGHERRAADAKKRLEGAPVLSPQQKLERLDRTLGVGVGAAKERAKLAAKISGGTRAAIIPSAASPETKSEEKLLAADGDARMVLSAGKVTIVAGSHQAVPVISMSQLRRMGDQHGFDGNEFARQYRAHLQTIEQP